MFYINIVTKIFNMKRIVLILIALFSVSSVFADSNIRYYKSTHFSYKTLNNDGSWTDWTKWETSDVLITMNFDEDVIFIYTPTIQSYKIFGYTERYYDDNGGVQVAMPCYNKDGVKGVIRLRISENGYSQLYVEFANIQWVYTVILVLK